MKKNKSILDDPGELRRRAEERFGAHRADAVPNKTDIPSETQRLLHELQVHQIELEMQNEELQQARTKVEEGLSRYTDLYEFAPVGYLTLNREGEIQQVNLTGARLLGLERSHLVGKRLSIMVDAIVPGALMHGACRTGRPHPQRRCVLVSLDIVKKSHPAASDAL